MESWGEDARRLDKMLHVGRQVSVEGILRYNTWVAQDGSHRGSYQIRVRAGLYAAFGKNKKLVDLEGAKAEESVKKVEASVTLPKVQLQQEPLNTAPCSVNTDEIPF
jgi:single-stranded DNA-binding protein